ncbi:MAG: bifunctional sulfate adenylyltransferase/adenylylsulfate kinase, partial [Candidatus Brocadiaceae bacterium]
MESNLIEPHGGVLVDLVANAERAEDIRDAARDWPSWDLTPRQLCDLELLLNGGFSPLRGFMTREAYEGVCRDMRLPGGTLWPMPIVLDVDEELADELSENDELALRDPQGILLAVMHVDDMWRPELEEEAELVFGTADPQHVGVAGLLKRTNPCYVGGRVEGVELPAHYDFVEYRLSPAELRERFSWLGWRRVVGFQTRNPMHRAHFELTLRAARMLEASLLIHPVVGMSKPGDVDHYTRLRCYMELFKHYPRNTAVLALLPLAMRMAGPREALWHALIRKNYGCTHFIVGRDHAGPGKDANGDPFYGPYEAQELLNQHNDGVGIEVVLFEHMVYVAEKDKYFPKSEVPEGVEPKYISGTELRARLREGRKIPEWFTFPEVAEELRRTYPPRHRQGLTVFFTGLPSSGKSTLASVLQAKLLEMGGRPVTLLDGDIVRKNLSSELGFSKRDRDINIRRIGFVASEITKNGGIAICA